MSCEIVSCYGLYSDEIPIRKKCVGAMLRLLIASNNNVHRDASECTVSSHIYGNIINKCFFSDFNSAIVLIRMGAACIIWCSASNFLQNYNHSVNRTIAIRTSRPKSWKVVDIFEQLLHIKIEQNLVSPKIDQT